MNYKTMSDEGLQRMFKEISAEVENRQCLSSADEYRRQINKLIGRLDKVFDALKKTPSHAKVCSAASFGALLEDTGRRVDELLKGLP